MPPVRRSPFRWGSNPFIRPNPILDALTESNKKLCREIIRLIPEVSDPHVVAGFVSLATDHCLTVELDGTRFHDYIKSRYSFHRQSGDHRFAIANTTRDCVKDYFARCVSPYPLSSTYCFMHSHLFSPLFIFIKTLPQLFSSGFV